MNCEQARKISIVNYLQSLGIRPVNLRNNRARYFSPLRPDEKKPSFDIDSQKNTFIDWGTGQKGDIITLVQLLKNTDTQGALKILKTSGVDSMVPHDFFPFKKQKSIYLPKEQQKIVRPRELRREITDERLINYLAQRKIPEKVWSNCSLLKQYCYYSNNSGKKYCNLAWMNDSGGMELNYRYKDETFKSCLKPKDITTIDRGEDVLNLFEGFFDYLSALTYFDVDHLPGTTIVLNTTAFLRKVLQSLFYYKEVNLYLDNDHSGKQTASIIKDLHKRKRKVIDQSKKIYPGFKDFNDFLVNQKS